MCGIAGFFGRSAEQPVPEVQLQRAGERMALRGPDGDGFMQARGVGLVHRRLAILDLAGGQQPVCDAATGVMLSYNGEIYNFKALRSELEAKGHRFDTSCDTEVLLRAWVEWGHRLRGAAAGYVCVCGV